MELLHIGIGACTGFLLGYLTSYFNEKGKNKALLGDIKRLTEEKEKVTSEFELRIAKRKYQYESKREQFFKFFTLLDQFGSQETKNVYEKFYPVIDKFNKDYLAALGNKKKELEATSYFSSACNKMISESNENLIKIRTETNTIRLIASDRIISLLDKLDAHYSLAFEKSTKLMTEMGRMIIQGQVDKLKDCQIELEIVGKMINDVKQQLITQVRVELDEI